MNLVLYGITGSRNEQGHIITKRDGPLDKNQISHASQCKSIVSSDYTL